MSFFSDIINSVNEQGARNEQRELNERDFNQSEYWNRQNYALSLTKFKYDQDQAALTRSREDNAIQRRVADLKASGMSPVLAAGSPAASSNPIVPTPTGRQYTPHAPVPMPAKVPDVGIETLMNVMKMKQDIAKTAADTRNIELQNERFKYDTDWYVNRKMPTNASGIGKDASVAGNAALGVLEKLREAGDPKGNYIKKAAPELGEKAKSVDEIMKLRKEMLKNKPHGATGGW